jgi:hypothetical protein
MSTRMPNGIRGICVYCSEMGSFLPDRVPNRAPFGPPPCNCGLQAGADEISRLGESAASLFRPAFFRGRNAWVRPWFWMRTPARRRPLWKRRVVPAGAIVPSRGYWLDTSRARGLSIFREVIAGKSCQSNSFVRFHITLRNKVTFDWHLVGRGNSFVFGALNGRRT